VRRRRLMLLPGLAVGCTALATDGGELETRVACTSKPKGIGECGVDGCVAREGSNCAAGVWGPGRTDEDDGAEGKRSEW
jgi:hypothetical protein